MPRRAFDPAGPPPSTSFCHTAWWPGDRMWGAEQGRGGCMMVSELSWLDEYRYAPADSSHHGQHPLDGPPTADTPDVRAAQSFGTNLDNLFDGSDADRRVWNDDALCAQTDPEAF